MFFIGSIRGTKSLSQSLPLPLAKGKGDKRGMGLPNKRLKRYGVPNNSIA